MAATQGTLEGFRAAALRVGVTGALRTAAVGTEVAENFKTKYDPTIHINRGYLSPDGVAINFDEDSNEFIPWQEMAAIRRDITKAVKSIKVTLWQFTRDNAGFFFGVPGGRIKVDPEDGSWHFDEGGVPEFEHEQVIVDVVDGTKAMRVTLLDAQVTEREGLVIKRDEAIGLTITLTGYPAGPEYASQGLEGKTARWLFSSSWDGSGATGSTSSSTDGVAPLVVQTAALLDGTVGESYTVALAALGGEAPYTWTLGEGSTLPDGLDLVDGQVTGTPTAEGAATVTLVVTDSAGNTAERTLTVTINPAG